MEEFAYPFEPDCQLMHGVLQFLLGGEAKDRISISLIKNHCCLQGAYEKLL